MTTPKLRMLYSSNIMGCPSGYGVQSASLLPRLAELPEFGGSPGTWDGRGNIAQHAWYGLEGLTLTIDGFKIYPRMNDPYGNDVIGPYTGHFGANFVVSLIDVWVMHDTARKIAPALWCPWLPIDCDEVPEPYLRALDGAYLPLTYSKWGHERLTAAGVENVYIAHGIEPSVYHVIPDREAVRKFKSWLTKTDGNIHLSVIVAANKGFPSRKWFEGQLEAWARFAADKPDAKLYIHSLATQGHGGVDFASLVSILGIEGRVIFPHPLLYQLGYPAEHLALIYNAADVLLSCSMSEGFGIPIVEAQACGTPVLVTDFSAMPELVRWGYKVKVADMMLMPHHRYQAWPSKDDMVDKLQRLYEAWEVCGGDWPLAKRIETQNAIHSEYGWDVIVRDQWAPLMVRLADEAPPLGNNFFMMAGAPPQPEPLQDSVSAFVGAVNDGIAQDAEKPRPQRRVEPLITVAEAVANVQANVEKFGVRPSDIANHANGFDAVPSNEESWL